MMTKSLLFPAVALTALGALASAQSQSTPLSVQGTPGHASIDMATGELTRDSDEKAAALVIVWANTDYSGYYSTWGSPGAEWLDWGILTFTTGVDIVGAYQFAYATTALDTTVGGPGASLCTNFYNGAVGFCAESGLGLAPDYQICWSGLPGTTSSAVAAGWIITVTLTGGFEFCLPPGPFGYSLGLVDTITGPLLCYAGSISGGADANGQVDVFDVYVPDVASGTCGSYWFGGFPFNFSAWWLYIADADTSGTSASCVFYCGSGVNAGGFTILANATLAGTFVSSVVHTRAGALLYAYATPLTFPYNGQEILINFLDPGGELLGNPLAFGNPAIFSIPVGINLAFCGFTFYVQAVSFGGGIDLHCAFCCVIGF